MIVAIGWPPNAGRVIFRLRSERSSASICASTAASTLPSERRVLLHIYVQMRAVCGQARVQTRSAARSQVRPMFVAAISMISGFFSITVSQITFAYASVV